ncbi:F-box protein SKIP23-like isoform X2 [Asparagus officinalis]|uniref:F-box protein SKIP23-like isoform X2 n=1 Tax=Asparagus officinalis TaxID=4686 RepID=UPI00098E667C|nr:F-box protein SKIP23-like isoform X2 [Asparagus officinalis]
MWGPVFASSSSSSIETLATSAMASGTVPSSHPDWANLLGEVLTLIAKRLSAVDYCSFSAVCTSWASIASPENGMPRPLSLRKNEPYLIFSGDGVGNCQQSDFCTLFDYLDNSFTKIHHLPEIRGKWIIGSQFGWLAVIDELANPSLLNPFTRSQIELPPITAHPEVEPVYDSEGSLAGYSCYDGREYYTLEESQSALVFRKLVLSSNPADGDFVAVAVDTGGTLMYTRPGYREWNIWRFPNGHGVADVIYRDGKFLALTHFGDVYAMDICSPLSSPKASLFAKRYRGYIFCDTSYLVDSSGVLLQVVRQEEFLKEESRNRTCKIEICSLDPETGTWSLVTSLGDHSLFVGCWYSASLSAKEISWLQENRVYFTDDNWDKIPVRQERVRDIGVFNLSDGSFGTCYPPDMRLTWPPPAWITSQI